MDMLSQMKSEIDALKATNAEITRELAKFKSCTKTYDQFVGFTAYSSLENYYLDATTIQFPNVTNNYGNAYDPTFSVFQCPVPGYYSFAVYGRSTEDVQILADIVLENAKLATVFSLHDGIQSQSGISVVTLCNEGDRVWVRASGSNGFCWR